MEWCLRYWVLRKVNCGCRENEGRENLRKRPGTIFFRCRSGEFEQVLVEIGGR